jgi:hypothetical protein
MKKTILKTAAIMLILAGMMIACGKEKEPINMASGTIIGGYNNGFISTIVQVDNKYSIGKSIVEYSTESDCLYLPASGTYHNLSKYKELDVRKETKYLSIIGM